ARQLDRTAGRQDDSSTGRQLATAEVVVEVVAVAVVEVEGTDAVKRAPPSSTGGRLSIESLHSSRGGAVPCPTSKARKSRLRTSSEFWTGFLTLSFSRKRKSNRKKKAS
ncbi:MAG: hypothetical protein QXO15_10455, partial [Nitrososphaerota archaeon]